jgi:hypothetical protein
MDHAHARNLPQDRATEKSRRELRCDDASAAVAAKLERGVAVTLAVSAGARHPRPSVGRVRHAGRVAGLVAAPLLVVPGRLVFTIRPAAPAATARASSPRAR